MKAYCVVYEQIHDPAVFEQYRGQVLPTIEAYGGHFIARGGEVTVLEGDLQIERAVILEFPSRQQALDWYHSPAYQALLPLRLRSTTCQFVVLDGVPG
jgi:uncharacterized protein (DUF1330 family)